MGTRFSITLFAPEKNLAEAAAEAAFHRGAQLDDMMSDYKADSELVRLSESPVGQPVPVSEDLFDILIQAEKFSKLSDGAFDVTVGPLVRLWRFARKKKSLPASVEVQAALKSVGYKNLRLDRKTRTATLLVPQMRLDLGGIAKGYAADQALAVLKSKGLGRALVAASGDIAVGDPPPGQRGWRVEIATLDAPGTRPMLLLHNMGISTSGDIEQSIEIDGTRYSHIVSPTTGLGLTNRIQVTMLAPNATTTDALATGISVLGPQRGMALVDSLPKTAALIFTKNGEQKQMLTSRRFKKVAGPILNERAQ
jgi:thiamine biosynthesis lipoprotein